MNNKNGGNMSRQTARIIMIAVLFALLPFSLFAKGGKDSEYDRELKAATERICTSMETREMNAGEAKAILAEIRNRYRIEYTDESGRMDAIIDELASGVMTAEQARNQFKVLEQARLEERKREELQQREQNQTRTQDQTMDQTRDQTQDQTRDKTQDQTQDQTRDQTQDRSQDQSKSQSQSKSQ